MIEPVRIVAVAVSAALLLLVLELVRRKQLVEEHAFIWIVCAVALLGLSIWRQILHAVAGWLGIYYPPALLLLVLIVFVFVASLYFSVVVSRQRAQIERLVEETAILAAQYRELARKLPGAAEPGATEPPRGHHG